MVPPLLLSRAPEERSPSLRSSMIFASQCCSSPFVWSAAVAGRWKSAHFCTHTVREEELCLIEKVRGRSPCMGKREEGKMSKRGGRSTNQAAPTLPHEPNQKRGRENDRAGLKKDEAKVDSIKGISFLHPIIFICRNSGLSLFPPSVFFLLFPRHGWSLLFSFFVRPSVGYIWSFATKHHPPIKATNHWGSDKSCQGR